MEMNKKLSTLIIYYDLKHDLYTPGRMKGYIIINQ